MVERVLIAAVAENGVIGRENRLLWRLRSDLRRFRALTMGHPVLVGRKTYDSIGAPLPGRRMVVVSRDPAFAPEGVRVARSIEAGLAAAEDEARAAGTDAVFVAGGGEIYAATLDAADRLEITHVALAPEGDAVFPAIDPMRWREVFCEAHTASAQDEAPFSFRTYRRR